MTDTRLPERWLNDRRILRLSDRAFRAFVSALMWSVSNRTEGVIEPGDVKLIPSFDPGAVEELVDSGLWVPLHDGWLIDGFAVTQTTRDWLEANDRQRAAARERKRRQRARQAAAQTVVTRDVPRDVSRVTAQGQDRTGEVLRTSSVTNQGDQQSLRNLGTSPRARAEEESPRPLDRMGRPSMSLTALTGGVERPPKPPPPDNRVSIEARDVVKAGMPTQMWRSARSTRRDLEIEADKLLADEADPAVLTAAIDALVGQMAVGEEKYPGHLKHVYARKLAERTATPQQIRNGQPMATGDRNFLAIQGLKDRNPFDPTRKELI